MGSGSAGNSTFIGCGKTRILIDAGFSARDLAGRLSAVGESPQGLTAIVVTHEHIDHVRGLERFSKKWKVPVFMTEPSYRASNLSEEGRLEAVDFFEPGQALAFGPVSLHPFVVPHDAALCVGFRIEAEGMAIGQATDLGETTALAADRLAGCDVLILESNHDVDMLRIGPYPWALKQRIAGPGGHLSNDACARLLQTILAERTRRVFLAHLSETNNHPDVARLTSQAALDLMECERPALEMTYQDRPAAVVEL